MLTSQLKTNVRIHYDAKLRMDAYSLSRIARTAKALCRKDTDGVPTFNWTGGLQYSGLLPN